MLKWMSGKYKPIKEKMLLPWKRKKKITLRAELTDGQIDRILDASCEPNDVGKTESESILQLSNSTW